MRGEGRSGSVSLKGLVMSRSRFIWRHYTCTHLKELRKSLNTHNNPGFVWNSKMHLHNMYRSFTRTIYCGYVILAYSLTLRSSKILGFLYDRCPFFLIIQISNGRRFMIMCEFLCRSNVVVIFMYLQKWQFCVRNFAIWRKNITLIHSFNGERKERDKGMKGYRAEWKNVKDEDTKESILHFKGLFR
jgi:hypothetical protein